MEGSIDDVLLGEGGAAGGAEEREDDAFVRGLFQSLLLTTRASNALPSGGDYEYANTYPSFREASQGAGEDVLGLLQEVLSHVGIGEGAEGAAGGEGLAEPEIFEAVADAVDGLLEEVDMQLDEMSGSGAQQQVSQMAKLLSSASNLPKPQEKFSKVPENARPLEGESAYSADGGHAEREHLALLDNLAYLEWQLAPAEEESPLPDPVPDPPYAVPPEIAARYVGTQEELDALRANLVAAREVGIDLEHHSFRSFQGFTCLMQITANGQDWLVDTLLLRHALHCLNAVFEDPSIVKVLHGCDSDVVWMQRDFGLYLVNVFDTGQAARYLGLQSFGLAYLLSTYCGVNVSKAHQLSDWRIRPLPDAMARYAQRDTRYLSYLHEVMRKELWGRGGRAAIAQVLDSSKEICRKRYERPRFDPFGWSTALQRQRTREGGAPLEPASMRAMEKLWDWRDAVAREEDESVSYVMSLRLMLRIAKELPLSIDALNLCGRPLPPLVQARSRQLLTIVTRALEEPELPDLAAKAQTPKAKHVPMAAEANAFTPVASEPYFRPFSVTPSHASEFVIQAMHSAQSKSAAAGAGGGHRSSDQPPPPVLDTEELYRTAGWTTPTPKHDNSKLRLAPENSSLDASLPMPHSLPLGSRNGRDDEGQASAHGRAQVREDF
jgi:exosome complex exonuclease RRP6